MLDVSVDGVKLATLDGTFAGGWGNYLAKEHVFDSDEPAEHEVSFTCNGGNFTLSGLLMS